MVAYDSVWSIYAASIAEILFFYDKFLSIIINHSNKSHHSRIVGIFLTKILCITVPPNLDYTQLRKTWTCDKDIEPKAEYIYT